MNRRKIWFLVLTTLSLTLGLLTGGKFPYLLFLILLLTISYSYFSLWRGGKNLYHFFWVSNDISMVGDFLEIGYKLNNTGFLPIAYVEASCNISKKLGGMTFPKEIIFLKPLQMVSIREKIKCKHRGYYQLGELEITTRDFFHIFERKLIFNKTTDLIVYPRVHEINRMKICARELFGSTGLSSNTHEDYTSIKNIREYIEGDNVKRIHWKLSAKKNKIYVKDYDLSANTKINIFLDGFQGSYKGDFIEDIEEKIVEATASIVKYSLKNDFATVLNIALGERTIIEGRNMEKFEGFLKELIGFSSMGYVALSEILIAEAKKLTYGSTLVILTTYITEKLFKAFLILRKKGFKITLILTRLSTDIVQDERRMLIYLKNLKIDVYIIGLDSNISDVLGVHR